MDPVKYFKALADETRLRILNLLDDREMNVNEITSILEMGQSRVSRLLSILTERQLLVCRRDGLWVFYSVPADGEGRRLLDTLSFLWKKNHRYSDDRARADRVMIERVRETARFFNSLAGDWDRIKRELITGVDIHAEIKDWIPSGTVAADLGCGTGDLLLSLSKKVEKAIGVDNSPKMLEKARQRFQGNREKIEVRIGDMEHLPLRDGEVDCTLMNLVLHHLTSPIQGLHEVCRILRNNGVFVLVELNRHKNENLRIRYGDRWLGFDPSELQSWLAEAGFTIKESKILPLKGGLELQCYQTIKKEKR